MKVFCCNLSVKNNKEIRPILCLDKNIVVIRHSTHMTLIRKKVITTIFGVGHWMMSLFVLIAFGNPDVVVYTLNPNILR